MYQDQTPVTELDLPPKTVEVLQSHEVKDYGTLCCVTLGQLKEWGLEPSDINKVINTAKRK